ncbi:hypothetical protein TanjilG_08578 [Lupinus angustifolius]|uniref:Plant bHLH transcription factor ACT-like domain-containing protein n=1 Tax=Lupinus angustifolius TaxID=3871 RepID=A0A4P1RPL8_LUPAN|nr:hypothetical protein TanjilG_08578 [Lupinus angustifolius]
MATAETSSDQNSLPMVTVETLGKGFLVNVISANSCPGLLVSILEAFEEINLNVVDARVSCADTFRFQAIGEVRLLIQNIYIHTYQLNKNIIMCLLPYIQNHVDR